ncbi:BTAD domain-containing putative transcriptional regulator [Umezawaea sp. NPDC059074]|uniref:AfsR/SARP family transcriptional regulator n=1 Tax=Umezawaea sp. NPDC059074 TaxID=3346716 RepID=UPI0036893D4C
MAAESGQGAPPEVAVGVLGNLEVHVDGTPVAIGHARRKAVLAVLLVEANRVVPADRLIDRVWGEEPPSRARSVLRTYLSKLRHALDRTGITITWHDTGYLLAVDPKCVDLHRFRRLLFQARGAGGPRAALALADEALALWRGEPLAEVDTAWAEAFRHQLHQERGAAAADRIDWALACGRHGDVLPELTTGAAEHPLDERAAGQVVLALYRSGRQADALEHYQRTRRLLGEELGADPGPALRELHHRVLTADPALDLPPAEPVRSVPRQLPAPPPSFVGRGDELDRLDSALDAPATVVISAIAGAGGIGKTWLALHWAHRNAHRFPDGQLFVDLHGFGPDTEPLDPATAVRGFLDALGADPGGLPADPDARAARYRSLVAGKRMLVVLDNAATSEQVLPLLPGSPTCTVLVTGRGALPSLIDRYGARHLHLGVLARDEARAVLVGRLGAARTAAEPDVVDELVDLCWRYPLALSITARRIATHPRVPLAEFAADLRELGLDGLDDVDPAASLPAVLSWSLRALTAEQRTVFALLGVVPGPDFGLPAAASLTGLTEARTRTALRALEDASLLDRQAHGRYAMHDLIRASATTAARRDLTEREREDALRRLLDFHAHTARAADRLLNPHRQPIDLDPPAPGVHLHPVADVPAALAWFDREHACLLAVHRAAVAHAWHPAVWNLTRALDNFHSLRGHHHDRLATWRAAAEAAEHLPDPTARAHANRVLGFVHADVDRHQDALAHLDLALVQAEGDLTHQAHIHFAFASVRERTGDDRRALEHARQALDLYRDLDQPGAEAEALNLVAWYSARLGDHDTARDHCRAALALHRSHLRSPDGEANTLDTLGYVEHRTGHHAEAIVHYRHALALYRDHGYTERIAPALEALAGPHAALGHHEEARAAWREALDLYREQNRTTDADRVHRHLAALDHA